MHCPRGTPIEVEILRAGVPYAQTLSIKAIPNQIEPLKGFKRIESWNRNIVSMHIKGHNLTLAPRP